MSDERSTYERVFGFPAPPVTSEFARISLERVVDGLWDRPGLAARDRRLLTLAVLAASPNDAALAVHLDGALGSGDLSAVELEEVAVQLAHYAGWPVGARFDAAARAAVQRVRDRWPVDGPVGVVGVGALGGDVAAALVQAGADVLVYDVRPEVAAAVAGATATTDVAELAAACAVVGIVVRDDAQVLDVVGRMAPAAGSGTVLLVHSTVSIETVTAAAAMGAAHGVAVVDVGLCRPAGLESGLVALVGGEADVVARARPVLDAVAFRVHHVGPLGSGMLVKAVRNAVLYGAYAGVSEGVDICRAAGIDVEALLAVLEDSGATGSAGRAFAAYREGWLGEAGGRTDAPSAHEARESFVQLARKDLHVAVEAAAAHGIDATFALAVAEAMPLAYLTDRTLER